MPEQRLARTRDSYRTVAEYGSVWLRAKREYPDPKSVDRHVDYQLQSDESNGVQPTT